MGAIFVIDPTKYMEFASRDSKVPPLIVASEPLCLIESCVASVKSDRRIGAFSLGVQLRERLTYGDTEQ